MLASLLRHPKIYLFAGVSAASISISVSPVAAASISVNTKAGSADAVNSITDAVFGTGTPASGLSIFGPTFSFQKGGVTLTFSNPRKDASAEVSRSTSSLGTCLGGSRSGADVAVCGNDPASIPQLNNIELSFNQAVRVLSTSGIVRGPTAGANVQSTWTSNLSTNTFNYTRGAGASVQSFSSSFTNFFALANTPITISSNFAGDLDYWMQSLEFETVNPDEVPAPLPLFGAASAFVWSRRVRRRIKASEKLNLG
jgi:hypothetical protein